MTAQSVGASPRRLTMGPSYLLIIQTSTLRISTNGIKLVANAARACAASPYVVSVARTVASTMELPCFFTALVGSSRRWSSQT